MSTIDGTVERYQFSVTVEPAYLAAESDPEAGIWAFGYLVRIRNTGQVSAQLIARHWVIMDASGQVEQVSGLGVVGHQPLLAPGESFEYTSSARLRTPGGSMVGRYMCVAEDGTSFDVPIPEFVLVPPGTALH